MGSFGPPESVVSLSSLFLALWSDQHVADDGYRPFNPILKGETDGTRHDAADTFKRRVGNFPECLAMDGANL